MTTNKHNPYEVKTNYKIYDTVPENQSQRYVLNKEILDSFVKEYIHHFDNTSFEYIKDDKISYNDQAGVFIKTSLLINIHILKISWIKLTNLINLDY